MQRVATTKTCCSQESEAWSTESSVAHGCLPVTARLQRLGLLIFAGIDNEFLLSRTLIENVTDIGIDARVASGCEPDMSVVAENLLSTTLRCWYLDARSLTVPRILL